MPYAARRHKKYAVLKEESRRTLINTTFILIKFKQCECNNILWRMRV